MDLIKLTLKEEPNSDIYLNPNHIISINSRYFEKYGDVATQIFLTGGAEKLVSDSVESIVKILNAKVRSKDDLLPVDTLGMAT